MLNILKMYKFPSSLCYCQCPTDTSLCCNLLSPPEARSPKHAIIVWLVKDKWCLPIRGRRYPKLTNESYRHEADSDLDLMLWMTSSRTAARTVTPQRRVAPMMTMMTSSSSLAWASPSSPESSESSVRSFSSGSTVPGSQAKSPLQFSLLQQQKSIFSVSSSFFWPWILDKKFNKKVEFEYFSSTFSLSSMHLDCWQEGVVNKP